MFWQGLPDHAADEYACQNDNEDAYSDDQRILHDQVFRGWSNAQELEGGLFSLSQLLKRPGLQLDQWLRQ